MFNPYGQNCYNNSCNGCSGGNGGNWWWIIIIIFIIFFLFPGFNQGCGNNCNMNNNCSR